MVKRKTARQKIGKKEAKKAVAKEDGAAPSTSQDEKLGTPIGGSIDCRLKRKQAKRMQFLSKLQENKGFLEAKKVISKRKHRHKKSALNNLSTLAEFLPPVDAKGMVPKTDILPKLNKAKDRQQLVVNEVQQLAKVLDHAVFKSNPFSAIHQHLANTLGPLMNDNIKSSEKRRLGKKGPKKRRKGKADHQNMEEM